MLRRSLLAFAKRPVQTQVSATTTRIFGIAAQSQSQTPSVIMAMSTSTSQTPMEDAMRSKLTTHLSPTYLEIHNDSHLHAHHKAMAGTTSQETHFRVVVTSEAFKGKMQPARHRMVYKLLDEEMKKEGGIHALQLRTRTQEEVERTKGEEGVKAVSE